MDAPAVQRLLTAGESQTVEFKRRLPPSAELVRDVAALANTRGGHLLIGVSDTGAVMGLDPEELEAGRLGRLAEAVRTHTEPPVNLNIEVVAVDGRTVAVVHVPFTPNSARAPFAAEDNRGGRAFWVRRGASSAPATMDELRRLVLSSALTPFEDTPVRSAAFGDLDLPRFREYLARRSPGARIPEGVSSSVLLRNAGFAAPRDEGSDSLAPTVGAVLLFGRAPQRFLPLACVELVRFTGDTPGAAQSALGAADRETVAGTLPEQLTGSLDFIRRHMRVGTHVAGFGREDLPEYPVEAVRELLLNALIHRDYAQTGAPIQVRMYYDRWQFISPGRLPGPLTPDALCEAAEGGERFARNPRIAEAMRALGHGEGLGLGLHRAWRALRDTGYPAIQIRETPTSVSFALVGAAGAQERQAWLRRHRDALAYGGNDRQLRALEYLAGHDVLTNADYRRLTGVVDMTALRDLTDLVERGVLERRGQKRGAYYVVAAPRAPGAEG
jgi:ATP-dependent DNA helicase RecG